VELHADVWTFDVRLNGNVGAGHDDGPGRRNDGIFVPKEPWTLRDQRWIIGSDRPPADLWFG
jgi:hypothetical protein